MKASHAELCWVILASLWHFHLGADQFNYHYDNVDFVQYSAAVAYCDSRDMQLLMAKTPEEMTAAETFIRNTGISNDIWLGLTLPSNTEDPANYVWIDGTPISWTQWGVISPPEPNFMSTDKCVALQSSDMGWYTRQCDAYYFRVICQTPTTTSPPVLPSQLSYSSEPPTSEEKAATYGFYFSARFGLRPDGPLLSETRSRSVTDCAEVCLLEPSCDVLCQEKYGVCKLYSSRDANLISQTQDAAGCKTYIKN